MTQLFRSKSCMLSRTSMFDDSAPPTPSLSLSSEEEAEEEEYEEDEYDMNRISTLLMEAGEEKSGREEKQSQGNNQFPILAILLEALRKSLLVTCSVEGEDSNNMCSLDIGWPTEVRHVSHVTFDRFNGFLGLPVEFEPELPRKVPSASVSVFGVSAESMQCSFDQRGNSVPTILLLMQKRLYSEGGLEAEGIFRINAENGQEEYVRDKLNRGLVPYGIDVHCLAGLIKAWFRELPKGILDALTPDQVMQCNTEVECTKVVSLLPPVEAALLNWTINLMADVVQCEHLNKMNARNIAMVFAPNMTQMADPLNALLHAVQVMNFLKTLIIKTLREREESAAEARLSSSCSDSPNNKGDPCSSMESRETIDTSMIDEPTTNISVQGRSDLENLLMSSPMNQIQSDTEDSFQSSHKKGETESELELSCVNTIPSECTVETTGKEFRDSYSNQDVEGFSDRLSWRGVKKLCRHPVFQLSKPIKKPGFGTLSARNGGAEAWT